MRNGQNKRMRGRNRKSQNPLTRVYESNGPDIKIRGTASHIAEKYVQLARDASSSGDPVGAENYYQHAEHYYRLIAAAQEQFRQSQPYYRPESEFRDEAEEGEDESAYASESGAFGGREPHAQPQQPHQPRESHPYGLREPQPYGGGRQGQAPQANEAADSQRLPSFITGGGQPQPQYQGQQNGYDNQPDRFPLHRRRRRRHGGHQSGDMGAQPSSEGNSGEGPGSPAGSSD
jgi:hypothetical protein